jgi:hypothetical protein
MKTSVPQRLTTYLTRHGMTSILAPVGATFALLLVGCGPLVGLGPTPVAYEAPVLRVSADEPTALAAVKRYVSSMGWTVDEIDDVHEHVVAHVDTRSEFTLQRDTWTFHATPGFLSVHRRMALGDTNGTSFVTSDEVCETYTYSSEETHLARIAALITSGERTHRGATVNDPTLLAAAH